MKNSLKNHIIKAIEALKATGSLPEDLNVPVYIERTRDPGFGDFACSVALSLAKPCQRKPMEIAEALLAELQHVPGVDKVSVASPGFINFHMAESVFRKTVSDILSSGKNYGYSDLGEKKRIHIEIVSANPTGPLHVGHGRLAAYSASLANVLEAVNFQVHREYYVNDSGRQMRILAVSIWFRYLQSLGEQIVFPRRGYKGDYITEIAETLVADYDNRFFKAIAGTVRRLPADDEEFQERYIDELISLAESLLGKENFNLIFQRGLQSILKDIHDDLQEFGVTCQAWFHESELEKSGDIAQGIETLRQKELLYEKDRATWFRSTNFGDEKDRVVIRENGQPTYFASDIGYHKNKLERGFDKLLDVYGADHHGYIPRLHALVEALGADTKKVEVLLIQFAILYRGKTRVSMSTRGGEFVTLRELREEVGNDAARFFYITRKREQHLDFDLELAKSQSNENPVYYIQYAYARICSVFRQLAQKKWIWNQTRGEQNLVLLNTQHEKELMRCLSRYPEVIELAALGYEPSTVAHYLQELANNFHAYYNAYPFLVEDENLRDARLCLVASTRQVLLNGLLLLGLSAPETM